MTKRYLGNIITQNPTAPAGNLQGSAAKGVWSLEEQLAYQKAGLWPIPGNLPPGVTDVFSTYLYKGTGAEQTITNGIDLGGEGGLVWIKDRTGTGYNALFDTERGFATDLGYPSYYRLESNATGSQIRLGYGFQSMNSDGFTIGYDNGSGTNACDNNLGLNGNDFVSWTFRKAPKFFTCVTYTGDSNATQTVNHDLGSVPGMIIIKKTDGTSNWTVYHRSAGSYRLRLNTTEAQDENGFWATSPTDTAFTLSNSDVKSDGATYVAYLFAHNDGDGGFGPDGSDIIKCGSYTGNGSTDGPEIDLGFEPQWIMLKETNNTGGWFIFDAMRGMPVGGGDTYLYANASDADATFSERFKVTPTGFKLATSSGSFNGSGDTYIYMAIRRGPLAAPTAGTEVFAIDQQNSSEPYWTSNFPVDFQFVRRKDASDSWYSSSRLLQGKELVLNSTAAEGGANIYKFDYMNGWGASSYASDAFSWMWKRAPGFFDVVAYTGNRTGGASQVIPHNLTVLPEMIWVKNRTEAQPWQVYTAATGNTKAMYLDTTNGATTDNSWGNTSPTATNFTVGDDSGTNNTGNNFIAYLFSTLAGISKVGSYTGTGQSGGDINVDCGFTSGARFVLIKRTDASGGWWVADTVRGIVTGNEPLLALNDTGAEVTGFNMVKPYSAGFIVNGSGGGDNAWNDAGGTYIFYAIA